MAAGRVNYGTWLFRIVAWDGMLPAVVILVPALLELLFPGNRGVIEVAALVLPIMGFFVRFAVGKRHITANQCGVVARIIQFFFFGAAVLILFAVDAVLVLIHVVPKGGPAFEKNDIFVFVVLALVYLTSMTIAMYPGRARNYSPSHEFTFGRQNVFDETQ